MPRRNSTKTAVDNAEFPTPEPFLENLAFEFNTQGPVATYSGRLDFNLLNLPPAISGVSPLERSVDRFFNTPLKLTAETYFPQ